MKNLNEEHLDLLSLEYAIDFLAKDPSSDEQCHFKYFPTSIGHSPLVRFEKLAVTSRWEVKKHFCRTSRYALVRAGVDSTYYSLDLGSTQLTLGSTQTSLGSTPATVESAFSGTIEPCIFDCFHWGRLKLHWGRPSQGFQRRDF